MLKFTTHDITELAISCFLLDLIHRDIRPNLKYKGCYHATKHCHIYLKKILRVIPQFNNPVS